MSYPHWQQSSSFPKSNSRLLPGAPHPLGATWDGRGTNFALFSAHAEKVELCLFETTGGKDARNIPLPECTEGVWHGYAEDVSPGQLYGYRVYGPYAPERGHRFNNNKLLIDPYAKRLSGPLKWTDAHLGYRFARGREAPDPRDNAKAMPKCVVVDPAYSWGSDHLPNIPWEDMFIYEAHVKGLTMLYPDMPPGWAGTYRGLAAPGVIQHLKRLGVTSIELLPMHAFVDDRFLVEQGLVNYWGYNSIGFFAPEQRYSPDDPLNALRTTVARLHDAGIEVILDVVYNHTAEGNHLGPTLSFRGIDNASYYWLTPDNHRFYENFTGCGNALNLAHPRVLQMVMDSLRYWVETCHVDGFRFDLATTLGRGPHGFDRNAPFFAAIGQDPVLANVKLIAEPWDVGLGGYQVGNFPPRWSEWNDKFRYALRGFWTRAEEHLVGEVATRMIGSADLFRHDRRSPRSSINHITVHDGFTLMDLVSYSAKHNEANKEHNRDGSDHNVSTNCGVEGPTDEPKVLALRNCLRTNMMVSLLLAPGVPLLLAGDEVGNTQNGNNNPYCQDNPIGWVDWSGVGREGEDITGIVARCVELRRQFPQLRPRKWLDGRRDDKSFDVLWLTSDAKEMTHEDWISPEICFLSYLLAGEDGEPLYIVLNAGPEPIDFTLPAFGGRRWRTLLNTAAVSMQQPEAAAGSCSQAEARSVLVFAGIA